jgi:hypothetical protein
MSWWHLSISGLVSTVMPSSKKDVLSQNEHMVLSFDPNPLVFNCKDDQTDRGSDRQISYDTTKTWYRSRTTTMGKKAAHLEEDVALQLDIQAQIIAVREFELTLTSVVLN